MKRYLSNVNPSRMFDFLNYELYGAVVLNKKYAYLHIWKSGGTTVQMQSQTAWQYVWEKEITQRKWITFVRDPLDHFLSGWAECGKVMFDKNATYAKLYFDNAVQNWSYSDRVETWLNTVKKHSSWHCARHSFPQFNYLLRSNTSFYENIYHIADLSDMKSTLEYIGIKFNDTLRGNIASENVLKQKYFQRDISNISDKTKIEICEYVAMDYCFFEFTPPKCCFATIDAICSKLSKKSVNPSQTH